MCLNILLEIGFKDLAALAQEICGNSELPRESPSTSAVRLAPFFSSGWKQVEVSWCSLPPWNKSVSNILQKLQGIAFLKPMTPAL